MSLDSDTAWLRKQLVSEAFLQEYSQQWLAVRDQRIVFQNRENASMMRWLEENDPGFLCVIAFADDRMLA